MTDNLMPYSTNACSLYGEAVRGDWGDFDGRSCRDAMDYLAGLIRIEASGDAVAAKERYYGFLFGEGICEECGSWFEWCRDKEAHRQEMIDRSRED